MCPCIGFTVFQIIEKVKLLKTSKNSHHYFSGWENCLHPYWRKYRLTTYCLNCSLVQACSSVSKFRPQKRNDDENSSNFTERTANSDWNMINDPFTRDVRITNHLTSFKSISTRPSILLTISVVVDSAGRQERSMSVVLYGHSKNFENIIYKLFKSKKHIHQNVYRFVNRLRWFK